MLGCLPNDDQIENIDPFVKMWCFYNWIQDQNDKVDLAKNHAYIIGSFINPEAVRKMLGEQNFRSTTDEEFEQSTKMMMDSPETEINESSGKKRRKRRLKK